MKRNTHFRNFWMLLLILTLLVPTTVLATATEATAPETATETVPAGEGDSVEETGNSIMNSSWFLPAVIAVIALLVLLALFGRNKNRTEVHVSDRDPNPPRNEHDPNLAQDRNRDPVPPAPEHDPNVPPDRNREGNPRT